MIQSGDIVISPTNGEKRVVIDVADYRHETGDPDDVHCTLRFLDDDERRQTDEEGGDLFIFAERASACRKVGSIYDGSS